MKYSRNIITDNRALICRSTHHLSKDGLHPHRPKLVCRSALRRVGASGTIQPKIDRFLDASGWLIGHRDFAALTGGSVTRVQRMHYDQAILPGGDRRLIAAYAAREM